MVEYRLKHALVQASGRIQGDLDSKVVANLEVQIGPSLLRKSYAIRTQRELLLQGHGLTVSFERNEATVQWWISADRKSAGTLSGTDSRPKDLNLAPEDTEWMDPVEIFARSQEFASLDKGGRVRRLRVPLYHRFVEADVVFHDGDTRSQKSPECRIEVVGLRVGDRKIDLSGKGLSLTGKLHGGLPEEIRISGFEPFNVVVRGQVVE